MNSYTSEPKKASSFEDWLFATDSAGGHHKKSPWQATLWLTGVDYFSSLGYAPGLAVLAAGWVAPLATILLVAVTFLAALPVYSMVAKYSTEGEGSIKMIERLTVGWGRLGWIGKVLVLTLIGFAMTDFIITVTMSSADAALHILENPLIGKIVPHSPVGVTSLLILGLCVVFLVGFREAIGVAVVVGIPYMLLSAGIVIAGIVELTHHPELVTAWWDRVVHLDVVKLQLSVANMSEKHEELWVPFSSSGAASGISGLVLVGLVAFPKLALGMSGFETGVSVMGHIKAETIEARIRNTRRLLSSAAIIMCVVLLAANFVATVLIPEEAYWPGCEEPQSVLADGSSVASKDDHRPCPREAGPARGRALAFMAHELLGPVFGTLYDLSTVLILWFAGSSAVAGMLAILPRYLPRFGMSPEWLGYQRPLVLLITGVCLVVTVLFKADVEAQGAAYATGVLVLMSAGAFAVLLAEEDFRKQILYGAILLIFLYVLLLNVAERPTGIAIAAIFIVGTVGSSIWSRWMRASELRIQGVTFVDAESEANWKKLQSTKDLVLLPLRSPSLQARTACEGRRIQHQAEPTSNFVFLHVVLLEDTSQFQSPIRIKATLDGTDWIVEVHNAVAVANAIAYVALELSVREVVIGLLDNGTPMTNAVMYLVFGTGEIGYAVRAIFMKLREQWLAEQAEILRRFDARRDQIEREVLRDLVVLDPAERQARMDQMFVEERAQFIGEVKLKRLPHLILFE